MKIYAMKSIFVLIVREGNFVHATANGVTSNKFALSEEYYMHILRTQRIQIVTYGAVVWKCKNDKLRKLGVPFNNAVRKVFGYRYESV